VLISPVAATAIVRRGRAKLQIPEIVIGDDPNFGTEVEMPDAWFTRLSLGVPAPRGFLFWSTAGWLANRDGLFYEAACACPADLRRWTSWDDFVGQILEELQARRTATAKAIVAAERKVARLRAGVL
jgi:hypothetical protein